MDRKITKFSKSYGNGRTNWPVAWAELECGHTTDATLDHKGEHAHDEAYYLTKIGDVVPCTRCDRQAEGVERLRAMQPGELSHSRVRTRDSRGFGPGDYYIYGRDPKSPTGVRLLFSLEVSPEVDDILGKLRATPLSPTERR